MERERQQNDSLADGYARPLWQAFEVRVHLSDKSSVRVSVCAVEMVNTAASYICWSRDLSWGQYFKKQKREHDRTPAGQAT